MRTAARILNLAALALLLTGCSLLRTAGRVVGVDDSAPSELNNPVPDNEYSAACQRKRGEMILKILGDQGGGP